MIGHQITQDAGQNRMMTLSPFEKENQSAGDISPQTANLPILSFDDRPVLPRHVPHTVATYGTAAGQSARIVRGVVFARVLRQGIQAGVPWQLQAA
jgi:hypothetical protein